MSNVSNNNKIRVEIIGDASVDGVSYYGCRSMWIEEVRISKYRKSGIEVVLGDKLGGVILCCAHDIKKLGWVD